ncbi:MAG: purine-binding chemotaxis protein CheW [Spirochaetales bacterium]|nr:purine-binding chemotaxis protein CheW [Spirochaetales bacterium]
MSSRDMDPDALKVKGETDSSYFADDNEEDMLVTQLNMDVSNQYVIFSVGNEEYGIPILSVQEIITMPNLTRIPGVPEYIPGIINLRGNIIPIYVLRSKFNLTLNDLGENTIVIIVQIGGDHGKTVGFIVDSVSDVVSITEENMRDTPDFSETVDVKYVEKIGQIGNRMIIVINLGNFFSDKERAILEAAAKEK